MATNDFPDLPPLEDVSDSDMDIDGDSFFREILEELAHPDFLGGFGDHTDTTPHPPKTTPHWGMGIGEVDTPLPTATILDTVTKSKELETCCICMDTFDGTRDTTLKCGHTFHTDCILGNISSASSNKNCCPLCRDEFCPGISVKEVDDLEEQLEAIENTLDDKNDDITNYKRAIYYLYDENEELYNTVTSLQRDKKTATHLSKKFLKTIHRLQLKLSKEIKENGSTKSYKKCRLCGEYGHNIVRCHHQSKQSSVLFGIMYYKYARSELRFNPKKRPAKEIISAIFPGGELYDAIDDHFE